MAKMQGDGLNVLVVEDDDDAATVEALVLGMENYAVTIASDGPAALRHIEQNAPDVVLLDIGLPGLNGHEVAERVYRMRLPKRPMLIALSGRDDAQQRRRSRQAGIDLHLVKPVAADKLCLLLRHIAAMFH